VRRLRLFQKAVLLLIAIACLGLSPSPRADEAVPPDPLDSLLGKDATLFRALREAQCQAGPPPYSVESLTQLELHAPSEPISRFKTEGDRVSFQVGADLAVFDPNGLHLLTSHGTVVYFDGGPCGEGNVWTELLSPKILDPAARPNFEVSTECLEPVSTLPMDSKKVLDLQKIASFVEHRPEGRLRKTALFFPRLIKNTGISVIHANTIDRVVNLGRGAWHLVDFGEKGHFSKAAHRFFESPLNPFGTANDLISDVVGIAKLPLNNASYRSSRIQVCSGNLFTIYEGYGNLSLLQPISPMVHVGVLIDGQERFTDPGGGGLQAIEKDSVLMCSPAPIMSGESEPLAIERLTCTASKWTDKAAYQFLSYNCAAFTRDVLKYSGIAFEKFPNLGIGNQIPLTVDSEAYRREAEERERDLKHIQEQCDDHIQDLRAVFASMESDQPVPERAVRDLATYSKTITPDVALDLLVGAANSMDGRKLSLVRGLVGEFDPEPYLDDNWKVKERLRSWVAKLRERLVTPGGWDWIRQNYPGAAKLLSSS
jgi:hypothetical protein